MREVISLKSGKRSELSSGGFIAIVAALSLAAFGGVFAMAFYGPEIGYGAKWQQLVASVDDLLGRSEPKEAKPAPVRDAVSLSVKRSFKTCTSAARITCIADGNTFWLDGMRIRIADIDTPELAEPKCASEAELGARATRRLAELLNAGPFELAVWKGRGEDPHGHKLRLVTRDGRSIGGQLVSEGLARTWAGRHEPWC